MAPEHYDMIHIHELRDYPETEAFSFGRTRQQNEATVPRTVINSAAALCTNMYWSRS